MFSNLFSFTRMCANHSYNNIIDYFYNERTVLNNDVKRMNKDTNNYYDTFINLWIEPTWIIDNIYLGNGYNASNYKIIEEKNIKTIINVTKEIDNYFEYTNEFNYIKIPINDTNTSSLFNHFDTLLKYINKHQQNDGNILIHCFAGRSRSATIVTLYLMHKYNMSLDNAIEYIKKKRNIININVTFYKELKKWNNERNNI